MQRRHLLQAITASAVLPWSAAQANAAAKLIVPFGPGGVTDLTGRTYAEFMGKAMGQTIIVENKPGAGATIGANYVVKAKPDGQTLLLGTNVTHAINPFLMKSFPCTRSGLRGLACGRGTRAGSVTAGPAVVGRSGACVPVMALNPVGWEERAA